MQSDDIRPPAAFDRTPADDALNLALAVTTAGLPAVVPTVTVEQDPARAAWSDQTTKDNDMLDLAIFARQALESAAIPCYCGNEYQCMRCRAEVIVARYLPHTPPTAAEPQQGTDLPW